MSTSETSAPRGNSLPNAVDIIIAPAAAFQRIREAPAWGWVFLIASVLGIVGFLLAQPATMHAFETSGPAQFAPQLAKIPPEKQAAALAQMMSVSRIVIYVQWIFFPIGLLIGSLISAVVMLIANAISKGDGTFKRFFALAVTTSMITALGAVLNGAITLVRGAASYDTPQAVQTSLPSLALLAPAAGTKLQTFLGVMNVASIWVTALTALGMIAVGHVKPPVAWTFAILSLLLSAGLAAAFVP